MGTRGLHITIIAATMAVVMLLVGISLDYQRLAFSVYCTPSAHVSVSLTNAAFEVFPEEILTALFRTAEDRQKFQEFNRTPVHHLQDVRDLFCGLTNGWPPREMLALCERFSAYYYGGLIVLQISVVVMAIEMIGCVYLAHYLSGRAKKAYRAIAFALFAIAPAAETAALLIYGIAIAATSSNDSGWITIIVTWTPGAGLIFTICACIMLFIAPCLSTQWKLEQHEFLNEERVSKRKQKVENKFMDRFETESPTPTFAYTTAFIPAEGLLSEQQMENSYVQKFSMESELPSFSYSTGFMAVSNGSSQTHCGDQFVYPPEAAGWYANGVQVHHLSSPSISEIPCCDPSL